MSKNILVIAVIIAAAIIALVFFGNPAAEDAELLSVNEEERNMVELVEQDGVLQATGEQWKVALEPAGDGGFQSAQNVAVYFYKKGEAQSFQAEQVPNAWQYYPILSVNFVDLNFDGNDDLVLDIYSGECDGDWCPGSVASAIWLYDGDKGEFVKNNEYETKLHTPTVDSDNKIVIGTLAEGGEVACSWKDYYRVGEDNSLTLVKRTFELEAWEGCQNTKPKATDYVIKADGSEVQYGDL